MIGFNGLFDTVRDYRLQITVTQNLEFSICSSLH
jgi:hypothetical protein